MVASVFFLFGTQSFRVTKFLSDNEVKSTGSKYLKISPKISMLKEYKSLAVKMCLKEKDYTENKIVSFRVWNVSCSIAKIILFTE